MLVSAIQQHVCVCVCVCVLVVYSCPALCNPIDCSPPGPSVHGILQAEHWSWLPFPSAKGAIERESEIVQSCPTLCNPIDCSLPGSCIHGIFQARILEWVAISFSNTTTWIIHKYTYNPSLLSLSPMPALSYSSRTSQSTGLSSMFILQFPTSYLFYIW